VADAIVIESLTKIYRRGQHGPSNGEVHALADVTMSVREGEFVSVFGPNAAGKTTLLLCTAGIESPTSGRVTIKGAAPEEAVVGFVFQNYREALLPWRTCLDNIAFPLEVNGVPRRERRERARELVRELELKIDLDRYPYQQSGGQQQLVAIARALISDPDVLVMDEPLSSLDVRANIRMRAQIESIWIRTGKPILYVSHDVDDSVYLSDRIVLLHGHPGRIARVMDNPLPRPRSAATETAEFARLRNDILSFYAQEE